MFIIVLNSFAIKDRPFYQNLDIIKNYKKVLDLRQEKLEYAVDKEGAIKKPDQELILYGNSEGGKSVLEYDKNLQYIDKKIIIAYAAENNYYNQLNEEKILKSKDIPVLNILGIDDEYFGKDSIYNKELIDIKGNSIEMLQKLNRDKILMLSNTKHYLFDNEYIRDDIKNFINK